MTDKVKSYADLRPTRVEPRLNEIYRKFAKKLKKFEPEIQRHFNIEPRTIEQVKDKVREQEERDERRR